MIHMIMHADDIVIIATCKRKCVDKVHKLMEYCRNNYISLQVSKCYFICFNSNKEEDLEPIVIDNETICTTKEYVYLGSVITDSSAFFKDCILRGYFLFNLMVRACLKGLYKSYLERRSSFS